MLSIRRPSRRSIADQRGQDTIEYIGVLTIVAALVAVAVLAVRTLGPTIAHGAECLVAKVLHIGTCSSGPGYPVSSSTKTVGYDARATIVNGGHSYVITLTRYSNGTSTITATNTGNLGVSAQWGADAELGGVGGAGVDASLGGGGYVGDTSTWTFPTWAAGQKYFNQIDQGSSLGLAAHDVVAGSVGQVPVAGPAITGLFDSITGASGAPNQGSLPHRYLTSTSTGGGVQGSADAGAHVNAGPLQAGVDGSLDGHVGIVHINYGAQKGDWQYTGGLDGSADGDLTNVLFGGQTDGLGTVNGDVTVTVSPNGTPLSLEVTASGDGVWNVGGPSTGGRADVPGGSSDEGSSSGEGSKGEGGSSGEGDEGGDEPLLSVDSSTVGGSGVGTTFTGDLDLSNDPDAQQDVTSLLEGNYTSLPDLINQMNSSGTETLQSYQVTRSNSTVGASASFGAGFGGHLNDGTANITYNPPRTREGGGKWQTEP